MVIIETLLATLKTELRFLMLQKVRPDLDHAGNYYLALGLIFAWLAGVGRYWDHPNALWWQQFGLISVLYIFVFALIIWVLLLPLRPKNWQYKSVLIFVGMCAPPGILYAIPVERFLALETAQRINISFLGIVAVWRVALLFLFLKRSAQLKSYRLIVATLFPLAVIMSTLALFNLEKVAFRVMAGLAGYAQAQHTLAHTILLVLTWTAIICLPVLLLAYLACSYQAWKKARTLSGLSKDA